jgi:hypothetical protein
VLNVVAFHVRARRDHGGITNSHEAVALLSDPELLARTRELVEQSHCTEADLLVHLGEIDERKLFLERAFPSMFACCVGEFRFSEDAAYSRIVVARAARELPAMIEAFRMETWPASWRRRSIC